MTSFESAWYDVQGHQEVFDTLPSQVVGKVDHNVVQEEITKRKSLQGKGIDISSPTFVQFACLAADEALQDAGWGTCAEDTLEHRAATGVCIGAGMSSTLDLSNAGMLLQNNSLRRISPFFVPRILVNAAAGAVSMAYGFHGPNLAPSTACATGAHAIGDAFRIIQRGDANAMLAGGTESCVDAISLAGFSRMKALSRKYNDTPSKASRPFDAHRDGFVLSEGACVLMLESFEHAIERGASKIYCEIMGYGMSGDAYHITKPREDGYGAQLAMSRALTSSGVHPNDVTYLNAHATSTPRGDMTEFRAIQNVFSDPTLARSEELYVSSSKGALGHMLGAAGAVEAAITSLACYHKIAPPNVNLDHFPPECSTNSNTCVTLIGNAPQSLLISHDGTAIDQRPVATMSNSFGFGGTNTSLLFGTVSSS